MKRIFDDYKVKTEPSVTGSVRAILTGYEDIPTDKGGYLQMYFTITSPEEFKGRVLNEVLFPFLSKDGGKNQKGHDILTTRLARQGGYHNPENNIYKVLDHIKKEKTEININVEYNQWGQQLNFSSYVKQDEYVNASEVD